MKTLKKYLSCLMAVMLILSSICGAAVTVYAADLVSGDYTYVVVNNSYAKITEYNGSEVTATIPSKLGNYTVKSIGEEAFIENDTITEIIIPSTVTEVCDGAFFACYALKTITVDSANKYYALSNGVLYTKDYKRLVTYPTAKEDIEYTVRSETTAIADGAFACSSVESVKLPSTITYLGDRAFCYCLNLSSINIPNGITKIGEDTFFQCESLESLTLPSSITEIGERAFAYSCYLESINLPDKIKKIGAYAFNSCESLVTITIPSGLTVIEEGVFQSCTGLEEVVFSNGLKTIGKASFMADPRLTVVNIPDGVTTIEDEAFKNCSNLTDAYITDTVSTIGNEAFGNNNNITIHCIKNSLVHDYAVQGSLSYKFFATAPQITAVTGNGINSVKITWSKSKGADGYVIMRSDSETAESQIIEEINDGSILTYTDNNAVLGENKYYTVKAYCYNEDDSRVYSEVSNAVAGQPAISIPKITGATPKGISSIILNWNKIDNVDGYYVYRTTKKGDWSSSVKFTVSDGEATSYTDTTAVCGTQYYYTIRAYIGEYRSDYDKTGIAGKTELGVPKIAAKATGFTSVYLSWNKIKDADGYYIYRSAKSAGGWSEIAKVDGGSKLSYTDKSVAYGTQYYYTIRAYVTINGKDIRSDYVRTGTAGKGEAVKPTFTVSSANYKSVKINWNKINGASGYYIYRTTNSNNTGWKKIKTITSGSTITYTDSTCTCGTTYYYTIRAYRTVNGSNVLSGYLKNGLACKPIPSTPSYTVASAGYKSVKINWNTVSGASGYYIYRTTNSNNTGWKQIKKITSGSTVTYTDSTCTCGTTYYYTIRAYRNVNGSAVRSNYLKNGKACIPIPSTPKVTAAQQKNKSVLIKWNKIDGATKYRVYRRTIGGTWTAIKDITNVNTLSYTDKPASTTTQYEYTVKAYRGSVAGKFKGVRMTMYKA